MKRIFAFALFLLGIQQGFSQNNNEYTTTVSFSPTFVAGDYIEFVRVYPSMAGAGGNYEISIAYTRGNVAAAATFLVSITHAGPALWREAGRINSNPYVNSGENFTIECNTEYANPRFRIRAINSLGVREQALAVVIKVRSINANDGWQAIDIRGNDLTVNPLQPMTNEWNLYVGNPWSADGAKVALKAIENGNVGIGTTNPTEKLSVDGNIRTRKVIVTQSGWPDYVFEPTYQLPSLDSIHNFIKENKHLPGMASAATIEKDGHDLGEVQKLLLKKVEELTLYMIEQDKMMKELQENNQKQQAVIEVQNKRIEQLEKK